MVPIDILHNFPYIGILVWRIWQVERQNGGLLDRRTGPRPLRRLIRVILESETIYTLMVYACTILPMTKSDALFLVYNIVSSKIWRID